MERRPRAARGPASRLALADQIREAWSSLRASPVRSVAMSLGVVLGVAAAVATVSLSDSARFEVSTTFARLRPTKVDVGLAAAASGEQAAAPASARFPPEAVGRVRQLRGVVEAGYYADLDAAGLSFGSGRHGPGPTGVSPQLVGADDHLLAAAGARVTGSGLTAWQVDHGERVAVVGARIADQLGIEPTGADQWVFVGGVSHLVVGRIDDGGRLPSLADAVVVPAATQEVLYPGARPAVLIHVRRGAAPAVAAAVPYALDPAHPEAYDVPEPGDPRVLRRAVQQDLSVLGMYLAAVSLVVGMVGIGTSTFGAIYERLGELGLRRALGARRGHLRRHVLTECLVAGALAGVAGTILGTAIVVATARWRGWVPVVDPRLALAAPLLGVASGASAGIVPAAKAGRIEPAEALRR